MNARPGLLRALSLALALAIAACGPAWAGRSCSKEAPTADEIARSMTLAENVQRSLDASGADVVLLARAGQNLDKYGLRYSHLGFAYRETLPPDPAPAPATLPSSWPPVSGDAPVAQAPRTVWRVVHKLNTCGTARSAIYRQGLGQFFLDTPYRYEAAYIVPKAREQAALLKVLRDNGRVVHWHTPAYSMVAYPWATTYQQSNQWALETLAGTLEPRATTRQLAQAWLQLHGYQPTDLHVNAFTRLGADFGAANISFDDHPNSQRFTDHILTVTVDSMFDWLQREHLANQPVAVR